MNTLPNLESVAAYLAGRGDGEAAAVRAALSDPAGETAALLDGVRRQTRQLGDLLASGGMPTPFRLQDGRVFVLDRGWVSIGSKQDRPDSVPAPPSGQVTVQARLQGDEGALPGRSAPAGEIPSIERFVTSRVRGIDGGGPNQRTPTRSDKTTRIKRAG